jgi:hypothetical protein
MEARAVITRREEERRQIAIEIDQDLADALVDHRTALAQVSLANDNVAAADEAFRVTQVAYDNGKTILAELYDALAVQVRTHVLRVDAVYRAQVALDRLNRVLGAPVPGVGSLTPYPAGWEKLSMMQGAGGEVAITVHELTVADFLVGVARHEGLDVDVRDAPDLSATVDGVFRGALLADAMNQALEPMGLNVEVTEGALVVATPAAP